MLLLSCWWWETLVLLAQPGAGSLPQFHTSYCCHLRLGDPDLTSSWAIREGFLEEGITETVQLPHRGVSPRKA